MIMSRSEAKNISSPIHMGKISCASFEVMFSTFLSHTSGAEILAWVGWAYPWKTLFTGEYFRTVSAILRQSSTEPGELSETEDFPILPSLAMRNIIPDSVFVSMLLILESSM